MKHVPILVVAVLWVAGCTNANMPHDADQVASPKRADMQVAQGRVEQANPAAKDPADAPRPPADPLPRKIIHTADVSLVVSDFEVAANRLMQLVAAAHGFVAKSDITGSAGAPRSGRWRIRLPVAQYQDFLTSIVDLGVLQKNTTDSQDVTEEYYDVEARIKNKRVEEDRLLKHLEKSTGKLEEILQVEKELSRVRGEIEQMQGRMRVLTNLSELTTVTVTLQEIKDYVPPQAPTFGGRASETFSNSLDALVSLGKGLALFAVGITPWLPVIAILVMPAWVVVRRNSRRRGRIQTALPADPPPA